MQFCNTITEKKKLILVHTHMLVSISVLLVTCGLASFKVFPGHIQVPLLAFDVNNSWYKCKNLLYLNV